MKTTISLLLLAGLALAGCSREDRADISDKSRDVYNNVKTSTANAWQDFKAATFEKKSEFSEHARAMQREFEAQTSKLKAEFSEAQASASRKAAMEELKNSEADYKQKLDALGNASADTWDAARDNVVAAWDRMQAAYAKARAD